MRITFVLPKYFSKPIGGYKVVYEYANHLSRRGHDLTVIYSECLPNWNPRETFYDKLRQRASYLKDFIVNSKKMSENLDNNIKTLITREVSVNTVPDSDIIVATFWPLAEIIKDFSVSKGKKFYLIQDFENYFGPKDRLENTWKLPFKKITISKWLYEKVLQAAGKENLIHIPIGVDFTNFRRTVDIQRRPQRVLAMYSTVEYKKIEDCIEAFRICKKKKWDVVFALFGHKFMPKVPRWIEYHYRISDSGLSELYNRSQIFCCSSLAEGFAMPPAEAMACGCAVATTDCGGNRDYAEDGVTALLSPTGNPKALSQNIIKLLDDDGLRVKLAEAAYEKIQNFTWNKSTDLLEGAMRS
ncbi:MAG: glycosyltransferase family 4 protein [Candidatus Omnitrophica bacterium]|nr:glycosyltransferase family 4 protein [Candidatus Omnitrophota bacterium]